MIRVMGSLLKHGLLAVCAVVAVAGVLRADDFWKSKPRSEWNLKQTLKLLQNSPWARQEVRAIYRPNITPDATFDNSQVHCDPDGLNANGDCLRPHVVAPRDASQSPRVEVSTANDVIFLIRWESSAPVEEAFTRLAELRERATAQYLSMPARLPADRYVVTLKALEKYGSAGNAPGAMPLNPIGSIENDASGPRARLRVGNVSVVPLEAERTGVGAAEAVHFYFPREVNGAPLIPPDRPSRVTFEFRGERFSVKTHFSFTPDMLK